MSKFSRIIESWRSWRRWSAVDRGAAAAGSAEERIESALRESAPKQEGGETGGAMRGRVLSRILTESAGGVSVGSARPVDVVRDRIGWLVGGAAVACLVLAAGLIAFRAGAPSAAPNPIADGGGAREETAEPRARTVLAMDVPMERLFRSVTGEPLEDEARRLMSDVKRAAAALQDRLPRLSFAEAGRGGGVPGM